MDSRGSRGTGWHDHRRIHAPAEPCMSILTSIIDWLSLEPEPVGSNLIPPRPEFEEEQKSELHTWVSGDPLPDGIYLSARVAHVRKLLAEGADVNERGEFGDTPLHVSREIEIAQALLDSPSLPMIWKNGMNSSESGTR